MEELIVVSVSAVLGGVVGSFLYSALRNYGTEKRVSALEGQLESATASIRGAKGNIVKAERLAAEELAIGEVFQRIQAGENLVDVIKQVGMKNPAVVQGLLKKYGGKI